MYLCSQRTRGESNSLTANSPKRQRRSRRRVTRYGSVSFCYSLKRVTVSLRHDCQHQTTKKKGLTNEQKRTISKVAQDGLSLFQIVSLL